MSVVRRTGLTTIRNIAFQLCQIITRSTPIIKAIYPDAAELHTALSVANTACGVLVSEANETLPVGD